MNESVIDQLIADLETNPAAADLLAGLISQQIANSNLSATRIDALHATQTRVLSNNAPVTNDELGVARDLIGDSYSDTLNFNGATVTRHSSNPRQVDIQSGAGADCMFDYLVSPCFATLPGFSEGMTFKSLAGCSFKGYSTVGGAVNDFAAITTNTSKTIAVCGGTYSENIAPTMTGGTHKLRIVGADKNTTTIGAGSGAAVLDFYTNTSIYLSSVEISNVTIQAFNAGAGDGLIPCIGTTYIHDCVLNGTASSWAVNLKYASPTSLVIEYCIVNGTQGLNVGAPVSQADIRVQNNRFSSNTTALQIGGNSAVITDNHFASSSIAIQCQSGVSTSNFLISRNKFVSCATCFVGTTSTNSFLGTISNNVAVNVGTFIDVSAQSTASTGWHGWTIRANDLWNISTGGVFIKFPTTLTHLGSNTDLAYPAWLVEHNRIHPLDHQSAHSLSLFTGDAGAINLSNVWRANDIDSNNSADSGSFTAYGVETVDGTTSRKFTGGIYWLYSNQPCQIGVTACVVRFGDTIVQVARQTITLPVSTTSYVEVSAAGTLSSNTSGFTAGRLPLCSVVTGVSLGNSTYVSHTDAGGILYVQNASGGGVPAASTGKFLTYATDTNLPQSEVWTPGSGLQGSGTPGGAYNALLGNLTADWNDIGIFNNNHAGHQGFGGGASPTLAIADTIVTIAEGFTGVTSGKQAVNGSLTATFAADQAAVEIDGLVYQAIVAGGHNVTQSSANAAGLVGVSAVTSLLGASTVVTDVRGFMSRATMGSASASMTNRAAFYAADGTGSGTIINQFGFYVPTFTKGGTVNWAFYSVSAKSAFGGAVSIGSTSVPNASSILDLTNAANLGLLLPVIANASQPTGAAGLVYYDSTKKAIYAFEDDQSGSSNVYQSLHGIRSIDFVIDGGGSALTTGVRPAFQVHFACTIVGWAIQGDAAGTCTIDVTTANDAATPSYSSIVGAGTKPNVAGPNVGAVLTAPASWTSTAIAANQYVQYNLSAVATFKWLTISLKVRAT